MMKGSLAELKGSYISELNARTQTLTYFVVTVLGFSFWFFVAVPFASHRESYVWLAWVYSQPFAGAFSFISVTYRPLAQAATWLGFLVLNPTVFPTSVLHQALLQGLIYGMFVLSWWLIYCRAAEPHLLAMIALIAGGVFFSGYVHLFHIYGMMYVPVMLMVGALLLHHASGAFARREPWFAGVAILLALWHPFATALFMGFYFGFYFDSFRQRSRAEHIRAVGVLLLCAAVIATLVIPVPQTETMSLHTRLLGYVVSYGTNEVNRFASLVAFLLTQMVIFSMRPSSRLRLAVFLFVSAVSFIFLAKGLPLLLLWICAVLIKLVRLRCWALCGLAGTAALLPLGGGIGTPMYALFSIIIAVYVTALGWSEAESAVSFIKTRYVTGAMIASGLVLLMIRVGIKVPIMTKVASPLLAERERTYQLESILAWLRESQYCGDELTFVENAGNPVDSVESAIARQNRPPAAVRDVQLFWNTVLRCHKGDRASHMGGTATVTFGGKPLNATRAVFQITGRYAGNAAVWIADSEK